MDFTEIFKQTSGIVAFSPGTRFILTAIHDRLVIRQADTLQITRSWQIPTEAAPLQSSSKGSNVVKSTNQSNQSEMVISHASWSCDSEYILAACAKRGTIDVFKLRDESWNSRITVGAEGLTKAEWAPDGRTIVCFSAWALRVTIWSLITGTSTYIQYPLHPDRGCAFRADGRYFVLAERHKSKDTLGVYDASESYRLVRHFPLPTSTLSSFSLSPNGDYLAAWESPMEYKIYILSLSGLVAGSFTPDPDPGYGIRCVSWHPTGFFLAVGGYDDKIYLLERLTWEPIAILDLQTRIGNSINIWREPPEWMEKTQGRGFLSYEKLRPPYSIGINRPDFSKSHPKSGVVQLSFNISGTLLLARFESAPTAVFLYSLPSASERIFRRDRRCRLQQRLS
ncbi:hypothetical protein QCA50_002096 [Cerrena zonata]|uniref:Uncharacterized protein n=1 Tax=Cerrena zonata TaxID=2478898 RepID=A0AAW0GWB5_9APHY